MKTFGTKINNTNYKNNKTTKKYHIIYPITKNKLNRQNSEYIKIFNNPCSNRFIYTKIINNIKLKNSSFLSTRSKNRSDSKTKFNRTNSFFKPKQNNNTKYINSQYNNNKKKIIINKDRIFTRIYKHDTKKLSFHPNETTIKNENKIIYKNLIDSVSYKDILKLWDQFYIPISYKKTFDALLNQLEKEDKNKLMLSEFNELNELKTDIDKLLENIKIRKELIRDLKYLNKNLKLIFKSDGKEYNLLLVKNMSNNIEKLRNVTINICFIMKKIKSKLYTGEKIGKYNIDLIIQNYDLDINYLIKMKEETKFLKEGNAKYFFNISEDQSPFLIKASEEDFNSKKDPFIFIVPITEELRTKIEKCNYIIYQELIAYQTKNIKNNIFRPISPTNGFINIFNKNSDIKIEKYIPKKEMEIIFPCIKRNHIFHNYLLKSNSCINFQIKNNKDKNQSFFLTNLDKNKNNEINEISNNEEDNINKSNLE